MVVIVIKNAFDAFMYNPKFSGWDLVHGIAVVAAGPHKGKDFGHAWLEKGDEVYDAASGNYLPTPIYYYFGKISYTVKYSKDQVGEMIDKFRHYGPWDEKINEVLHSEDTEDTENKEKNREKKGKGKKNKKSESCIRLARYLLRKDNKIIK